MKTGWKMLLLAAVLFLVVAAVAYAAQQQGDKGSTTERHAITVAGGGMMRGGGGGMMGGGGGRRGAERQGQGGMGRGMMMMGGPMHGMVLTSAVSASGENVYVLIGDQLMVYDRALNLQKQVDVKVDWAKMKQTMEQMRRSAPAMDQMMNQGPQQ